MKKNFGGGRPCPALRKGLVASCLSMVLFGLFSGMAIAASLQNNGTLTTGITPTKPYVLNVLTSFQNATGAGTAVDLGTYLEDHGCTLTLTGTPADTDTATVALQGSLDDNIWYTIQTAAVANTTVTAFQNSVGTSTSMAVPRYIRDNVTAISVGNLNSVGVDMTCVSRPALGR